jgi:hypothetical protein
MQLHPFPFSVILQRRDSEEVIIELFLNDSFSFRATALARKEYHHSQYLNRCENHSLNLG